MKFKNIIIVRIKGCKGSFNFIKNRDGCLVVYSG